ncbi:MAG: hypothetical protein ACREP7_14515 [Lysobacter sp.]
MATADHRLPYTETLAQRWPLLIPLAMANAYPYLLQGFHRAIVASGESPSVLNSLLAALCLLGAIATPLIGLACAKRMSRNVSPVPFELRARRLAYLSMAAPPLFVLTGVGLGLLHIPLSDKLVWVLAWSAIGVYVCSAGDKTTAVAAAPAGPTTQWRVAHGICGALITCFVLFHLSNHLLGWLGPDVHAAVMAKGRSVYRASMIEPVLIGLLLFQVFSGARLAWRASAGSADVYRVVQIGSGLYLAAFVLTHLNSALVSARAVRHIETDWAWASGAPEGLLLDAWNIRLLPHYAFGVFFILTHLCCGLRQVALAHGVGAARANRIWVAGLFVSALISAAIMAGLCGARL